MLTTLWATGARISEVLTLRPRDIHRQGLVLPNLKNPSRLVKTAHLSAAHAGLPGDLLVWARENGLADDEPLFFSRQHTADGRRKAIDRVRAWQIVKSASERADVRVLALRATGHGAVGEPAPVHPHLFRHARVRQIVRHTKSLALAQKQAGWARLHTEYLTLSDDEAQRLMRGGVTNRPWPRCTSSWKPKERGRRPFTEDDLDNLFDLDSDPDVMRFINGGRPTPLDEVRHEILPTYLRPSLAFPAADGGGR